VSNLSSYWPGGAGFSGDYFTIGRGSGRGRRRVRRISASVTEPLISAAPRVAADFDSNLRCFLIGDSRVLSFHAAMDASRTRQTQAGSWFVEADPVSVTALARRHSQARLDDERAKSVRIAIVASLFFVLLAATLLIGGHAALDPLLQSAMAARQSRGVGEVVYTMPDGVFCRHMSFDNITADVNEGTLERCSNDVAAGPRLRPSRSFAWPTN
jgi:hypothetical protein